MNNPVSYRLHLFSIRREREKWGIYFIMVIYRTMGGNLFIQNDEMSFLSFFAIAVITTMTISNVGEERVYSFFILLVCRERKSLQQCKAGNRRQEVKQESRRKAAHWLAQPSFL